MPSRPEEFQRHSMRLSRLASPCTPPALYGSHSSPSSLGPHNQQKRQVIHFKCGQFSIWSSFTFPVHLVGEKMTSQFMFVVSHQSLVLGNTAILGITRLLEPTCENNSFTSSLLGCVFFNCASLCMTDSTSMGGNTEQLITAHSHTQKQIMWVCEVA